MCNIVTTYTNVSDYFTTGFFFKKKNFNNNE
jgi:hypothetical protein